jgi:hypothetical protein
MAKKISVEMAARRQPNPWYIYDDADFRAPGPEFKLDREAVRRKTMEANEAARRDSFSR